MGEAGSLGFCMNLKIGVFMKFFKSFLARATIAAGTFVFLGNAYAVDTGLSCQTVGIWNVPPTTNTNSAQGTNVKVDIGIAGGFGGVGVLFALNGVNILESRAATGGGWQTSNVIWDGPLSSPTQYILFNQGAGNTKVGQWGYHNTYSGLTALDFNPLWSDNVHPGSNISQSNPTGPCQTPNGYKFDHGKVQIGMAVVPTSGHGNAVMLTNQYTYQSQVNQSWSKWYAEQAFYLDKNIARMANLRVYLTKLNGQKQFVNPFDTRANRIDVHDLAYAILVWNIFGQDIGVAIDARKDGKPSFYGSLVRQDSGFSCTDASNDLCGVLEWHTYMDERENASFRAGELTQVATHYRVGTLQQLAAWNYTTGF
jgi:hypothetical protein